MQITAGESLELLGDKTNRDILIELREVDESISVSELSERLGLPRSTLYRKLKKLDQTPLIEERLVPQINGGHYREYLSNVDEIHIRIFNGELDLKIDKDKEQLSIPSN